MDRMILSLRRLWASRIAVKAPLDRDSQALLDRLTAGLADPCARGAGFRLVALEVGGDATGAPTLAVERLGRDRYVIARHVELVGVRHDDPEVNDRVADPEVEFRRNCGEWHAVRARSGLAPLGKRGLHDAARTVLRFAEQLVELVEVERSAPMLVDIFRNRRQS